MGTDEDTLIEILASRTNRQILDLKKVYKEGLCQSSSNNLQFPEAKIWTTTQVSVGKLIPLLRLLCQEYKKELEDDIKSDTSGDFRTALIALCKVLECVLFTALLQDIYQNHLFCHSTRML